MRIKAELFFTLVILVILSGLIVATVYVFQELIFKNWESEQDMTTPMPVVMPEAEKVKNLSLEWINGRSLTYKAIGYNLKMGNMAKTPCPAPSDNASLPPTADCYILNYTFQSCQQDCYAGSCLTEAIDNPRAPCNEPAQYRMAVLVSSRNILRATTDDRFNELSGEMIESATTTSSTSMPVIKDAKQPTQ